MEHKAHILVVDDDDRLRALIAKYLGEHGFWISYAANAAAARRKMAVFAFDLLVLDVMMPQETGLSFLASLGENRPPTLVLSARGEAEDRISGLEAGAEDYLTKPFDHKELLLRVQAILRRVMPQPSKEQILEFGDFRFYLDSNQLKKGEEIISLTSSESAILKFLASRAGTSASRAELSQIMPIASSERSVDVQVLRLRKKIEENDSKPKYLQTIRNAGYVLYARGS